MGCRGVSRPERLVVVGRDAPLWLAANVLQMALRPSGISVCAIELPSELHPCDAYATLPALEALHAQLNLDEAGLLRVTGGAFSLGQNFVDLSATMPDFLNGFGGHGGPIDGRDFFGYWVKARGLGLDAGLEDFSLTAAAARAGRMMIPDDISDRYCRADYGYHLPAIAYAAGLKSVAARIGVTGYTAREITAVRDAERGTILAVEADGQRIEGQLFVDASGAEAALVGGVFGVERDSWRAHFPADRVVTARASTFASVPVYAELRASAYGWTGLYPSQTAAHVVHAFSSALISDEDALHAGAAASGLDLADAVLRPADPGCRALAWTQNCVAIGGAACAFDPVHTLDLHAVQLGLINLLACFPASDEYAVERAEYNIVMRASFERLRDYQAALYTLARYPGAFWDAGRANAPSPELAHRIATFRARGEIPPMEHDSVPLDNWRALLVGLGIVPESYAPQIDTTSPDAIKAHFRQMLGFVKETVLRQPTHMAALGRTNG